MFSTVIKIREIAKLLHSNAVIIVLWPNSDICKAPFRILMFEIARQVSAWDFNNDSFFLYMISDFESGLELIEVLSICFEVSSSSLRQVMDYQFPPLMGPGRRATFGKCQLQQKFSFLIRWTFKLFVAIFCFGERNSKQYH